MEVIQGILLRHGFCFYSRYYAHVYQKITTEEKVFEVFEAFDMDSSSCIQRSWDQRILIINTMSKNSFVFVC